MIIDGFQKNERQYMYVKFYFVLFIYVSTKNMITVDPTLFKGLGSFSYFNNK